MAKLRKLKNKTLKIVFFIAYISYVVLFKLSPKFKSINAREAFSRGQMEGFMGIVWFVFWGSLFLLIIYRNPYLVINPYLFFVVSLILFFINLLVVDEKNYLPFFKEFKKYRVNIKVYIALFIIFNIAILVSYVTVINIFTN